MIYKNELMPYKSKTEEKKIEEKKKVKLLSTGVVLFLVSAFFAARVNVLEVFMPFGIAFFIAVYGVYGRRRAVPAGIISCIGYLLTFKGYTSISRIVVLASLILLTYLVKESDKNRFMKITFVGFWTNIVLISVFRSIFITDGVLIYDIILSVTESIILAASAYIFCYGVPLYFDSNKRKMLSKEELIYICLMFGIIVSGTYDIQYKFFSLKNVIGFFFVLAMGYTEGAAMGAVTGVSLGLLSTLSDNTMPVYLGIYAFCGLISGVFRELGKIMTGVAFAVAGALMTFYTGGLLHIGNGVEIIFYNSLMAIGLFLIIPRKNYESLSILLNDEKRSVQLQKSYIERVKDIMNFKLSKVSTTLSGLSSVLEDSIENELDNKVEIDGLIEKLADRVCFTCDGQNTCWRNEMYYTYDAFLATLRTIEKKGVITVSDLPDLLKRKCIKPNELSRQANGIFEIFRLNTKWKKKLVKSRSVLAEQVKDMSIFVKSMLEEAAATLEFKNDIEEEIAVALDKNGLDFDDVLAIKNHRNRYEVTLYKKPCEGQKGCNTDFPNIISKVLSTRMVRDNESCNINKDCSMCQFRLVEGVNYNITTAIARCPKDNISGDNYSFGEIGNGRFMVALSDGMGSGAKASNESSITISLLEKFIEAGYERNAAIKATNSVLVFRENDENFATIDFAIFDLYEGIGEFIKIGSAATYIKSGKNVTILNSYSLPVGILDDIDIESDLVQFSNGDMVVMVTDGVTDADTVLGERWISSLLREYDSVNPKEVADYILFKAKDKYGQKVKDDMTVIVIKIWKLM